MVLMLRWSMNVALKSVMLVMVDRLREVWDVFLVSVMNVVVKVIMFAVVMDRFVVFVMMLMPDVVVSVLLMTMTVTVMMGSMMMCIWMRIVWLCMRIVWFRMMAMVMRIMLVRVAVCIRTSDDGMSRVVADESGLVGVDLDPKAMFVSDVVNQSPSAVFVLDAVRAPFVVVMISSLFSEVG